MVSTTAVAGVTGLADFAGMSAPADLAGADVPAVAGMKFSAVAEVYSSAVDDEGVPLVIRTSRQRSAVVNGDPMEADRKYCGPRDRLSIPEPLEHSVVGVLFKVGDSSVDRVAVSNPIEHSGVGEATDLPSARSVPKPLEHSVVGMTLEEGDSSVDRVAVPNPIEHSGVGEPTDPPSARSVPEPLEHSVVGVPLEEGDSSVDRVAESNPIEHSGVNEPTDPPSVSQPKKHSEVSGDGGKGLQDHVWDDSMLLDIRRKDRRPSPEDGEAIVVGAVVSDGLGGRSGDRIHD